MIAPLTSHNQEPKYKSVSQEDSDVESVATPDLGDIKSEKQNWRYAFAVVIALVILLVVPAIIDVPVQKCHNPKTRREWRSLVDSEQKHYIDSVQCLMKSPSRFEPESFRWDDFAYAHTKEGTGTHYTGAFLTWHRYFLHVYETVLMEECGFRGAIPYWDWSLDSDDLAASPIWDNKRGFGGNGKPGKPTLAGGRCVEEGPFANTTRYWQAHADNKLHVYNVFADPHCFSRGFATGDTKKRFESDITPDRVNDVLAQDAYDEFFAKLELGTHNAVPQFISGDFYFFTAPNDPVFYLHHAQIDRLWWMWQQKDAKRLREMKGSKKDFRHFKDQAKEAALDDELFVEGFEGRDAVKVKDVMESEKGILCYHY